MTSRLNHRGNFETVAAGSTATKSLTIGPTYLGLLLQMNVDVTGTPTDVPITDWHLYVDEIRIRMNGNAVVTWDAATLTKYNNLYGIAMRAGVLPILFTMPWARTLAGEIASVHGTVGLTSYNLEVEIKEGVTVNNLELYTHEAAPQPAGAHMRVRRHSAERNATGQQNIRAINTDEYFLAGVMITSTAMDRVQVFANDQKVYDTSKLVRESFYKLSGRVLQSALTLIDFTVMNQVVTPTAQGAVPELFAMNLADFEIRADWTSAPGAYDIWEIGLSDDL